MARRSRKQKWLPLQWYGVETALFAAELFAAELFEAELFEAELVGAGLGLNVDRLQLWTKP